MTQVGPAGLPGNVPVELTQFIGRERELHALRQLAGSARLLTLTGAGGSGKSRLALELVSQPSPVTGDGVAWVELAPLMEPGLVPGAVLRALGTPTEGGAASAETIISVIRDRALLVVLDNCEHLIDAAAELVDILLRACPNVRIIATSREALGVAGERAWLVPPLTVPPPDARLDVLAASDAVRLFVDRARDVQPQFSLSPGNAVAVAAICARLDGIPLAIELAAARVRHLSPDQIRDRLGDAFALLTTGARTALPRHRTLRATLDWSHDLLPEPARVVLRRLAVCRGGFTLDMVEAFAAGDGIRSDDVLDLIGMLADRSLLMVREHDGTARYQMLETIRQYAERHLDGSGEGERVRSRFADAVTALVAEVEPSFTTRARRVAFGRLEPELDNIREVLAWTREQRPEQHVHLVGMLWWFWYSTRYWVEAHGWITGALALPAAARPTPDRAALLFAGGALAALRADPETARPLLDEAIGLAATLGDERLEAYACNYMAMTWAGSMSPRALEYTARAERWLRAHGDAYGLRLSLLLGGMAEFGAGHVAAARTRMEEAVGIARSIGQDRELAIALQTLATLLLDTGDVPGAQMCVRESLEALRRDPAFLFIARAIDYCAYATCHEERPDRAAWLLGIAAALRRHIGARRFPHDEQRMARITQRLRERLGEAEFERLHGEGMDVPPVHAIDEVLDTHGQAIAATAASPTPRAAAPAAPPSAVSPPAAETVSAAGPVPDLCVRALGPLEVIVQGQPIETWAYTKPKEMLVFLLLHPQGRTRAEIGEALWPGAGPAQVRNSFHVTMHHLRRTIGHADWLVLEAERYRATADITVDFDVATFQRQVQAALTLDATAGITALRAALALYRDHFLAGETTAPWRDDVQDRLRRMFCDAQLRLGALLEAAGDHDGATAAYEAVLAGEPLHEEAHRALIVAITRSGRRVHALRHMERFTALLEQLELEPEEETLELYERIRSADMPSRD
ncbi:MAG TPA: BTAD domain-containing putative transcriptional regulator [Longimicrobiales bacterium]